MIKWVEKLLKPKEETPAQKLEKAVEHMSAEISADTDNVLRLLKEREATSR